MEVRKAVLTTEGEEVELFRVLITMKTRGHGESFVRELMQDKSNPMVDAMKQRRTWGTPSGVAFTQAGYGLCQRLRRRFGEVTASYEKCRTIRVEIHALPPGNGRMMNPSTERSQPSPRDRGPVLSGLGKTR
jgi:hypothetical protein